MTFDSGRAVVAPVGELDLATADELAGYLELAHADGSREVVLDLRGLDFLDSTGIRLMLHWHQLATNDGFAFTVVPGNENVQRLLTIAGVANVLRFVEPLSGQA